MIRVVCSTNLDDYKREIWPTHVAQPVKIADRMVSQSGKVLAILGIRHGMARTIDVYGEEPAVFVDLNKIGL